MGLFNNLTTENIEESKDSLGGFGPMPSGVYDAVIKLAYAGKSSSSDAQCVTVHFDVGGQEMREQIWVTNGKGQNFYTPKGETSRLPLPGFTTIDELCLLATGEPLSEQPTETKTVKLYNFEEKKELPTEVPVLVDLIGKPVKLGILRQIVDKQTKGDDGVYRANGETRTENTVSKVFHPETKMTVNEYRHEINDCEFHDAWQARNKGKDRDRSTKGAGGSAGGSGNGRPGGQKSATKKLFG